MKILGLILSLVFLNGYSQNIKNAGHSEWTSHGYLRTGIGGTCNGEMVDFVTPNNLHKYRMGNEANHYAELQFDYHYNDTKNKPLFEATYMMAKYIPYGDDYTIQFPQTTQLCGRINDVIDNADIWVGKRYYDRRNIELLDYFWLNSGKNSEVGFGIENINVGKGILNISVFKFNNPTIYQNNVYKRNALTLDIRRLDIPLGDNSKLNFLLQLNRTRKNEDLNLDNAYGAALGAWYTFNKNKINYTGSVIFRKGSSIMENIYSGNKTSEIQNNIRIYDLSKASSLDITNNFLYDDKSKQAIQVSITYHYKDYGIGNVSNNIPINNERAYNWFSVGFRYLYYISKNFNLALEAGNDYVKDSKDKIEGSLQKITFSPQISWNYGYYSRPVLRPFITFSRWSNSFQGITGINKYNTQLVNKNEGVSYGLQLEIWW